MQALNAKDFQSWFGMCESRLRLLIAGLESQELGMQAYPFAKFFNSEDEDSYSLKATFFIGLRFAPGIDALNLKSCTNEFVYKVSQTFLKAFKHSNTFHFNNYFLF